MKQSFKTLKSIWQRWMSKIIIDEEYTNVCLTAGAHIDEEYTNVEYFYQ